MSSPLAQNINQLSIPKVIGISLLLGALYYRFSYNDGSRLESDIVNVQNQVQAEEEKKKETDRIMAEEAEMKRQVVALAEKFKEITLKFPVNLKSDEIIATINSLASTINVRVVSVKKEKVNIQELYEEIPLKIEFSGTFNNLILLLYNISILEKVTNFGDFKFANATNEYTGMINLETTIIGYKYRKPETSESSDPLSEKNTKGEGL